MNVNPEIPDWPERDIFILSKGHAAMALYAALAAKGFFLLSCWNNIIKMVVCLQNIPLRQDLLVLKQQQGL